MRGYLDCTRGQGKVGTARETERYLPTAFREDGTGSGIRSGSWPPILPVRAACACSTGTPLSVFSAFTTPHCGEGTLAETPPYHDAGEVLCRPQQRAMGKAKKMPHSEDTKILGKVVCLVHSVHVRSQLGPIMCQNGTCTEQHT